MSDRTGLNYLESQILLAAQRVSGPDRAPRVMGFLREVEDHTGIAPYITYECMLGLIRRWVHPYPLLTVQGNVGAPGGYMPAEPRYLDSVRLTEVGALVAASESGEAAPFPYDLIVGTFHDRGYRAPFHPARVASALLTKLDQPSLEWGEFVALLGLPVIPTGCEVSLDLAALASDGQATLTLGPQIRQVDDVTIKVYGFAPQTDWSEFLDRVRDPERFAYEPEIQQLLARLALDDCEELTDGFSIVFAEAPVDISLVQRLMNEALGPEESGPIRLSQFARDLFDRLREPELAAATRSTAYHLRAIL